MKFFSLPPLLSLLLLPLASAQGGGFFTEEASGVTWGVAIPDVAAAPYDILLSISAPATAGWVGWASGGCMLRSPLVVAWADGKGGVTAGARWATAFHGPALYPNATLTVLPASKSNATAWTAHILCSGCSMWPGGSIDPKASNGTFGWGVSSHVPAGPTDPNARIGFHDVGKDHFELDWKDAKVSMDAFGGLVKSFGGK